MKLCEIVDESRDRLNIGFLFYYEKREMFIVEIRSGLREEELPLFLASFVKRGRYTLDPSWSRRWVGQRIIPSDRQNLGAVLKENNLREYDAFSLLMLGRGRCAQDDCAVIPTRLERLPAWLSERLTRRLDFALSLKPAEFLLIYRDGTIRVTDIRDMMLADRRLSYLLHGSGTQADAEVLPGGVGLTWGEGLYILSEDLHGRGEKLPLTAEDLKRLVAAYVMDTSDVMRELDCSRQYVNQLVLEGKLEVLRQAGNTRLYPASELISSI